MLEERSLVEITTHAPSNLSGLRKRQESAEFMLN
jgi:hypothetical protein